VPCSRRTPRSGSSTPTAASGRRRPAARRAASPWRCRWPTAASSSGACWSRRGPTARSTPATCGCSTASPRRRGPRCARCSRRLVYDLRPPQLDELGLTGALREQAARFSGQLAVSVAAPDELPPLPAAVEVAAYRIVTEALTNVARHAGASTCRVELALDGSL